MCRKHIHEMDLNVDRIPGKMRIAENSPKVTRDIKLISQ